MFTYLSGIGISFAIIFNRLVYAHECVVEISNNGPIVFGASITFTADLRNDDGKIPQEEFLYKWRDNLFPQNKAEFVSNATSTWTVRYPAEKYHNAGVFKVGVTVYTKAFIVDWPLCRAEQQFRITSKLNGNLTLLQNNATIPNTFVSNACEVEHDIRLTKPDLEYIKQNSSSINTFWYIDCELVQVTNDLVFRHNYTQPEVYHDIHAFVVVSNLTRANTSLTTSSVQPVVNESSSSASHENSSTSTSAEALVNTTSNSSVLEHYNSIASQGVSFDCKSGNISVDEKAHAIYGLFTQKIVVMAPVENVTAAGNQWIQHWDMMNLTITCHGSPPFKMCYDIKPGYYNATGNETCRFEDVLEKCEFSIPHYFPDSSHYSVLLIIRNDINKVVRSIGIDVYEVTKHPQLSVIVVPIAAAIVAVVLIIFGIAYYIQSRNRFMIEVADFDFSTNASEMEYKTFRERLVEAFHNAFEKPEDFYEQDSTSTAPTNKKYGSMP